MASRHSSTTRRALNGVHHAPSAPPAPPSLTRFSRWLRARGYGPGRSHAYTHFYCDGSKAKPSLRGLSHEVFFALTPALWAYIFFAVARTATARAAASVFMACWAAMFGCSSQFHRRQWDLAEEQFMSDLDHVGILLMVAGSYVPLAQLLGPWKRAAFCAALSVSLAAGARHSFTKRGSRWGETLVAFAMAAVALPVAPDLYAHCTALESALHWASLAQFGAGGIVYAARWPDPWPASFGSQEIFHALTCTGGLTVYAMNCAVCARV